MSSESTTAKKRLRQHFRAQRRNLTQQQQTQASRQLSRLIFANNIVEKHQTVAVYLSNDSEISCHQLIQGCWQRGINTVLPIIHPITKKHLLFLHYDANTVLVKNRYGICEPKLDVTQVRHPREISAVFMPLVAFDLDGNRLGMGGGFYDRTFQHISTQNNNRPSLFGVAHDCQKSPSLNTERWDIPMAKIFTPSGIVEAASTDWF